MKLARNKKQQSSLAKQYAIAMVLLISVGMAVLATIMLYSQIKQGDRYLRDFGAIITEQLANAAAEPLFNGDKQTLETLVDYYSTDKHIAGIGIFNKDKIRIASKGSIPVWDNIRPELSHYRVGGKWSFLSNLEARLVIHIQPIKIGMLEMGFIMIVFSQESFDKQFREQMYSVVFLSSLLLLFAIGASIYL